MMSHDRSTAQDSMCTRLQGRGGGRGLGSNILGVSGFRGGGLVRVCVCGVASGGLGDGV